METSGGEEWRGAEDARYQLMSPTSDLTDLSDVYPVNGVNGL